MSYLTKKMLRSIKQFKLQFVSVLLLAILSVTVYSGLEGVWRGIEYEFDSFVEETNLADEWVMAAYITDEDVDAVLNTPGVSDVSKRLRINVNAVDKDGHSSQIILDTVGNTSISSMYIMDGKAYSRDLKNSVWLDKEYSDENGIKPGDSVKIDYKGTEIKADVAGIIMSSERTHFVGSSDYYVPDHKSYGYGFMSNDLVRKFGIQIACNLLEIKSTGSMLKDSINNILGQRFITYYDRSTLFDVSFVSNQAGNLKRISILFSALFILLAVLSMHTTIKRLIDAQSSDIATLKSLGISNKSLMLHYSMYGLSVSVLGTLIGFIASYPFSLILQTNQKMIISIPEWPVKHTIGSLVVILLLILLSVLTSVLAAKKPLTGLPAEHTGKRVKRSRSIIIEKLGSLWKKTGFGMRWTLRDAAAHKTRIFLGIASVCGSFMLLMIGFGMPDSIASFTEKTYSKEFVYTNKIILNTACTSEELGHLRDSLEGQFTQTVQSRVRFGSNSETYFKPVTVFSDGEYINLRTMEGRELTSDGAYITEGMAESLNVTIGDTVELFPSFSEKSYTFKISGIIPSSMPQSLYISNDRWSEAGALFRPTHLLTGKIKDLEAIKKDPAVSQIISRDQQGDNLQAFRTAFTGIFNLMKLVAFALVVIVLYNLSILSFIERSKEYNTFRVLGFHYNEIRVLASFENVIILGLGTLAGLPLGYWFLGIYCSTFSNDTLKIYPDILRSDLAFVCGTVFLCIIATTLLLSLKIRKIDMVRALKE